MKNFSYFVGFCALLGACAPTMQVQRLSIDKADEMAMSITDEWVMKDTELAIQDIIKQMKIHGGFQSYLDKLGRKPKLFVGDVQNQTSEAYFPIGDLNDELLQELSFSGKFTLIDAAVREKLLKEIQYQNDGMVDPKQAKNIGKASGADFIIFGDIRMKPDTFGKQTVKNYSVNLRMTNIETGEEVLRVRYKTSKYSKHSKYAW